MNTVRHEGMDIPPSTVRVHGHSVGGSADRDGGSELEGSAVHRAGDDGRGVHNGVPQSARKIFFWSADSSGCAWYRCELPAIALAQRGHNTLAESVMPPHWVDSDVHVGQRVSLPGASQRWQELAKLGKSKMIYELDDDLLDVDPSNTAAWDFFSKPDVRQNIKRNIACSDAVIVTSPALAEAVRQINSNIVIIGNFIPEWMLHVPTPNIADGLITVGWAGGASHRMDWNEAQSEVGRFVTRNKGTEMHVMGWRPAELWRRLPESRRRFTAWIDSLPDLYRSIDFHVGLAPLKGHIFNRSKSPIKALEYAALGVPAICSNYGPYADFVRHGETGFLVNQPHEWASYLRTMLDPTVRQAMGEKARNQAAEHTIEANAYRWEEALCQ